MVDMKETDKLYRDLQKHLDRMPVGYPATKSGVEIRILKHLFTPEEAEVALQTSMLAEPIERIYRRVKRNGMSFDKLQQILDTMEYKGTLVLTRIRGQKHYGNAPFIVGMWEFQVDRLNPDFIKDEIEYSDSEFGQEINRTRVPQLRTVPVSKSISLPTKYPVGDYDIIRKLVDANDGQMAIANCICRQVADITGKPCSVTDLRETCLMISPGTAQNYINMGIGKPITKENALAILDEAQEAGLVIQPLNSQRPEAICCCCGDCCGVLKGVKKYPRPADLYASNFFSSVDAKLCTGCQICVQRCQLGAPSLVDGIASINLDRCIGCGNCVVLCPSNAIVLKKKKEEIVPPKSLAGMQMRILSRKIGKLGIIKMGAKMVLKQKI